MANGAGLAMATMDAVTNAGGKIANFLDVGGGANAERVRSCYELVMNHTGAKVFFINIFGGITRGDEVARGIVTALEQTTSRKRAARHSPHRHERRRGARDPRRRRHDPGRDDGRRSNQSRATGEPAVMGAGLVIPSVGATLVIPSVGAKHRSRGTGGESCCEALPSTSLAALATLGMTRAFAALGMTR